MPNAPPTNGQLARQRHPERFRLPRSEANKFRSKARWQRFRKWFVNKPENCYCADPFGTHVYDGRHLMVTHPLDVHHIVPLEQAPELACVEDNCVTLCRRCHKRVEGMVQAGRDTRGLFGERSIRDA
jgi:5-methylcytosine-specific restriction endonuclease McrA